MAWLGPEANSLGALSRRGTRARLDDAMIPGARVVGAWTDHVPWMLERHVGRGLALTVGLPASLDASDLAVRPAFLAILDHVLRQADQRVGLGRGPSPARRGPSPNAKAASASTWPPAAR